MLSYLRRCISDGGINKIRIATGYWDLLGMSLILTELQQFLDRTDTSIELLIGKDPYVFTSLLANAKYKDATYPYDFIRTDIHHLEVKEEYKAVINLLLKYCGKDSKLQIRIYTQSATGDVEFLHSKCYIFSGRNHSFGIIGSSNFTQKGLLGNAELNYLETNPACITARPTEGSDTKGHVCWFEEKWALSKDWTQEFLEQVIKTSPIYYQIEKERTESQNSSFTPYELYIKLLQLQFGDVVDKNLGQTIESYLPADVQKFDYQIEAVKRCLSIMHEHGGFMLADVVGLGKTIVGILIIKHFLSVPENFGERERKVLIITPPAIQMGWQSTIAKFDEATRDKMTPYVDYITTGRISSILDEALAAEDAGDTGDFGGELQDKNYGLIIIDESHKFRNSSTQMYRSLDRLIGEIGARTGVFPYVGLLSATPQNNSPNDLKNQIYLFERNHNESTLKKADGGNLERFFAKVNKEYDLVISKTNVKANATTEEALADTERLQRLEAISEKLRDCILCDILERRTRTDVEMYYKDDVGRFALTFPKIEGPNNLKYVMDDELAQLFSDTMTIIAPTEEDKSQSDAGLNYSRYRAIEYFVSATDEQKYVGRGNRGVNDVAKQLATLMQILLVKRLESSFTAFTQSLLNLHRYTENMIDMWENDTIFICPQIDINKELDFETKSKKLGRPVSFQDCVEDVREKITKLTEQGHNEKAQNAEYTRDAFKPEYYDQLKKDLRLISSLCKRWAKNSADPKFDAFKKYLTSVLFDPQKNTSGKLVIFSEAIDTVQSLARAVRAEGYKPLVITAAERDSLETLIEENFDANYRGEWKEDYNVLITTEVLAEGVNLHRANVIVNYDTPWNATRLMQRIGRVNRIGSKEPAVYVYNFMPSAQGDAQIQLVRKAHTKLQSFHILFGGDSKIFSEEESVVHYDIVRALKGDESPLQKYVFELKQYKSTHAERYKQIELANESWQIAQGARGTAYFVVKAQRSARIAIKICTTEEGLPQNPQIISLLELLEEMRTDVCTKPRPLPNNWALLTTEAIKAYNQYFVRINKSRAGDKRTQALRVIVKLYNSSAASSKSQKILESARKLVDKGSYDVIIKMLEIGVELDKRSRLFAITQQDIDDVLETEIGKLVAKVEEIQGEASIILGTIK